MEVTFWWFEEVDVRISLEGDVGRGVPGVNFIDGNLEICDKLWNTVLGSSVEVDDGVFCFDFGW